MNKISILDIGLGNIRSVTKAFEKLAEEVLTMATPEEIIDAEAIVLPGVGAFQDGMKKLEEMSLIEPLHKYAASNSPLLGICLGMQLLMSKSYEFGECAGLNIVQGEVIPFMSPDGVKESGYKVPHVGWNEVLSPQENYSFWENTILNNIPNNSDFYFVHSFYVKPIDDQVILATTEYGQQEFCSVLKKGNIYGTQFHPEKSGKWGVEMLKNWLEVI